MWGKEKVQKMKRQAVCGSPTMDRSKEKAIADLKFEISERGEREERNRESRAAGLEDLKESGLNKQEKSRKRHLRGPGDFCKPSL